MRISRKSIWMLAAGLLIVATGAPGTVAAEKHFPSRALRGYGEAEAVFRVDDDGRASTLVIQAAGPEEAKLWQAKFLSDVVNTTGTAETVRLPGPRGDFQAFALPRAAGYLACVRDGSVVTIVFGGDADRLRAAAPAPTPDNTVAAVEVPMYLDSWDRYAFRFYYRPEMYPPDTPGNQRMDYNPQVEFDYAKDQGGLGFVFWVNAHNADAAYGLNNAGLWSWAYELARQRKLPVVLNTNFNTPSWIGNAFREDMMGRMPHYGGFFRNIAAPGGQGAMGATSWVGDRARMAELHALQDILRRYDRDPVIELLEPNGELHHGDFTTFQEYGPTADASYREYLALRHGGEPIDYDDRRVPELAAFAGWDEHAQDLSGAWRIGYLELEPDPREPGVQYSADDGHRYPVKENPAFFDPDTDDSDWPRVGQMPGSDELMYLVKRPAVLRRHFQWDGPRDPEKRTFLYVWDLNRANDDFIEVHLNGQKIGVSELRRAPILHHGYYDVTDALRPGDNLLALRLPKGVIGYRIYLTQEEPKSYPYLSPELNAEWADFCGWMAWSRARAAIMGIAALREIDPDRSIVSMSPDRFFNQLREIARRYGTHFHNTGYMSGNHAEMLPMLMRGADLPFSLEPSQPAHDLHSFKWITGHWIASGVNAVHYFIHVGDILWNDEIRAYFEKVLPALRQMGRQRIEKSEIAMLMDSDNTILRGFPWTFDPDAGLLSGFWSTFRFNHILDRDYPMDGLIPDDFAPGGLAEPYKIVFDTNTTIMSAETVANLRDWVERGGVFVAMTESGRHLPDQPDAWPLSEVTGFQYERFSRYGPQGAGRKNFDAITLVPGQTVFDPDPDLYLKPYNAEGVKLHPAVPEAEILWQWPDGSGAIGMRRLGKGVVFTFGMLAAGHMKATRQHFLDILRWTGTPPRALTVDAPLIPRNFVSTNGLYDLWLVWSHPNAKESTPYVMRFRDGRPEGLFDVLTGQPAEPVGVVEPLEFVLLASPRRDTVHAAERWFVTQRDRWQGAEIPPFSIANQQLDHDRFTLPLEEGWEIRPLDAAAEADPAAALARPDGWKPIILGPWIKDHEVEGDSFLLRRQLERPARWTRGDAYLWLTQMYVGGAVWGEAEFFLDGESVAKTGNNGGVAHAKIALPAPGAAATLGLVLRNRNALLRGVRGACFLTFIPTPEREVDLSGTWTSRVNLADPEGTPVEVPGTLDGALIRRDVDVPEMPPSGRVFLFLDGDADLTGAMINGHFVRRHHHRMGNLTWLDVTPWIKPGAVNDIVLSKGSGPSPHTLNAARLHLHNQPLFND